MLSEALYKWENTMQYNTIQCNAIQYNKMQCNTFTEKLQQLNELKGLSPVSSLSW